MITWGTKPVGYITYTQEEAKNISVETGDIYGVTFEFDGTTSIIYSEDDIEKTLLEKTKRQIISRGDTPVYIEVDARITWVTHNINHFHAKVTFFAKKGEDPIWLYLAIVGLVSLILKFASDVIESYTNLKWTEFYVKYYEKHGKPPEKPPEEKPSKELGGLAMLILIIIILYALSQKR